MNKEGYYRLVAAIINKAIEDYKYVSKPSDSERKASYAQSNRKSAYKFLTSKRFERLCELSGLNADEVRTKAGVEVEK